MTQGETHTHTQKQRNRDTDRIRKKEIKRYFSFAKSEGDSF